MVGQDVQAKIAEFQALEQELQSVILQKQSMQAQLIEIESALNELDSPEVYKIVGAIMVKADPEALRKELSEKKELLSLRIDSLSKKEESLRKRFSGLQEELKKLLSR